MKAAWGFCNLPWVEVEWCDSTSSGLVGCLQQMPALGTPSIEPLPARPQVKMLWRLLKLGLVATSCMSVSGHEWYTDISASDANTLKLDVQVGPVSRVEKVTKESVKVQWELASNRNRPRVQGYELQYLILAQVNAL